MSSIRLNPCQHPLTEDQLANVFGASPLSLRISENTQNFFSQVNQQMAELALTCPTCEQSVSAIGASENQAPRFPLIPYTFSRVDISPLSMALKSVEGNTPSTTETLVHFRKIELANIENGGRTALDGHITYNALADLANDFNALLGNFGPLLGRLVYYLPTSWKAHLYIAGTKKAQAEGRARQAWLMSDPKGKTIGYVSFREPNKEALQLDEELARKKILEVGVLLHSDFQRKGVVSQLNQRLFEQISRCESDVDALLIATRKEHEAVNYIAQKLHFSHVQETSIPMEGLLPFWGTTHVAHNIYIKTIGTPAEEA